MELVKDADALQKFAGELQAHDVGMYVAADDVTVMGMTCAMPHHSAALVGKSSASSASGSALVFV